MKILKALIFLVILFGGWETTANAIKTQWHLPKNKSILPYSANKTDLTIEERIRIIAREERFKWPDYLVRLADCESKLGKYKDNKRGNYPAGSVDRGVFMINNYWHSEVSDEQAYDLDFSTRWTIKRINQGYQHEWSCDKLAKK